MGSIKTGQEPEVSKRYEVDLTEMAVDSKSTVKIKGNIYQKSLRKGNQNEDKR